MSRILMAALGSDTQVFYICIYLDDTETFQSIFK